MKKIYVLDTNVILQDSNSIYQYNGHDIVIPSVVLQEIDSKKKQMDEIGKNARHFSRIMDELRETGRLHDGVKLKSGGTLRVEIPPQPDESDVYHSYYDDSIDTAIIATAKMIQQREFDAEVILVSRDTLVRVKSDVQYVNAIDYAFDKVADSEDDLYKGYTEEYVDNELIDKFYEDKSLKVTKKENKQFYDYPDNHFFILKSFDDSKSALCRKNKNKLEPLFNYGKNEIFGIRHKNVEQMLALELLLDDSIPLVTLSGKAGTGKTLLALAAALHKTLDEKKYTKILVARPIVPMGKDLGYLPGEKEEKLRPWMQPIYDNLEFLFNAKNANELDKLMAGMQGELQVEALTYIRGRSIPNQFIIVDEAQNLTQHEVKTITTRIGEGSKVVLLGDPYQIDHPYLDIYSNGLTYVTEKLKYQNISGHMTLNKGERSTLAQLCADLL